MKDLGLMFQEYWTAECSARDKVSYNWCYDGSELFPCQLLKLYIFILCPEVKGCTLGTPYLIASDLSPLNRLQQTDIIPTSRPGKSVYNHWCQLGQQGCQSGSSIAFHGFAIESSITVTFPFPGYPLFKFSRNLSFFKMIFLS